MFRVFVCDYEECFCINLREIIEEHLKKCIKQYEIQSFISPDDLLKANYEQCDVFCLDVELNHNMNGIDLAKIIRKKNYSAFIIFITSHPEIAYCAFEVETFGFLLKPIQREEMNRTLDLILRRRKEQLSKIITLQHGKKFFCIPYDEIIYFETVDRKLRTITTRKEYLLDNKINELDKLVVDKNFFRIHKSYLINLAYVKEYDQTTVTMQNGDVVFLSRLRVKEFKEKFRTYLREEYRLEKK